VSIVFFLLYFDAGGSVRGCMCMYTQTHTHIAHEVLDVSPGVEMRHLEGLKNPDGRHILIRICMQNTHVYIYARFRDEILTKCFFSLTYFSF